MRFRLSANVTAGILFLLAASLPVGIWVVYLFVAMPNPSSPIDSAIAELRYTFSAERDDRLWFAWLAALPFACAALGVAYLLNASRSRATAVAMLSLSGLLAAVTFFATAWPLGVFVALPMVWGYRCIERNPTQVTASDPKRTLH